MYIIKGVWFGLWFGPKARNQYNQILMNVHLKILMFYTHKFWFSFFVYEQSFQTILVDIKFWMTHESGLIPQKLFPWLIIKITAKYVAPS